MKSSASAKVEKRAQGAFLTDGSFYENGGTRLRGHVHGLTRALVLQRRDGSLSVMLAIRAIEAGNATLAFPNVRQWEKADSWPLCFCSTSAEQAVQREGRGPEGHWCGERWLPTTEKDCGEGRHRPVQCPPEMKTAIEATYATLLEPHNDPLQPRIAVSYHVVDENSPPPMI